MGEVKAYNCCVLVGLEDKRIGV